MKEKFPGHAKMLGLVATGAMAFGGAGCADATIPKGAVESPQQTSAAVLRTETPSQAAGTPPRWYFIQGPHSDGLSAGKRYAIDIGVQNPNKCPGPPVYGQPFPSPAAGEVIHAGGESLMDEYHSIVEIQTGSGEIIGIMHLANIKARVRDMVKFGDLLGDPSCEVSPKGKTDSTHVHVYLKDIEENPAPIKGTRFTDGVVGEFPENYKGYLDKGGVQLLSDPTHYDSGVNKNVLENYLQLVSTGNGSFRMELRFADGKPVYNQTAYIFSVKRDIDGKLKPNQEIKKISSGDLGILQATLPPGEYILLFDKNKSIKGPRSSETEDRIKSDINIKQDQITTKQITLGRVTVNMGVDPKRPTKGFFSDRDVPSAEVCIDGNDNGKVYEIYCIELSDVRQGGIVGKSRAVFDLIPDSSYSLNYGWYDATNGWQRYWAEIYGPQGQARVLSGQTIEFNCLIFAPKTRDKKQSADCTVTVKVK